MPTEGGGVKNQKKFADVGLKWMVPFIYFPLVLDEYELQKVI